VDDLFFAGGADAMDVDGAGLDDEEAVGWFSLVEEVLISGEGLNLCGFGDGGEVGVGEAVEEAAGPQAVGDGDMPEVLHAVIR